MPDRYGDPEPVADFDSRRRARETARAEQAAQQQRERLAATRATHAPLSGAQSNEIRAHRHATTDRAETRRNKLRIANCRLCDDHGYRGGIPCDHIDHRPAYARGMANLRRAMGWTEKRPKGSR